jgi:uncharacterized protein (TIRG00374 family)
VRWWWLIPAVVLDLMVYVCAALEWRILLQPIGRLSFARAAQALFVGRFANDVLPVHAGYVIRIFLVSRWLGTNVAAVVPSLLIERLLDGLWLALALGPMIFFFPLPERLARGGEILGAVIVFGVGVVMWLIVRPPRQSAKHHGGWRRSEWVQKVGAAWLPVFSSIILIAKRASFFFISVSRPARCFVPWRPLTSFWSPRARSPARLAA